MKIWNFVAAKPLVSPLCATLEQSTRIAEEAQPRAVFSPAWITPDVLNAAKDPFGVRHQRQYPTIGSGQSG
jgi:hypothetical protein